MRWLCSLSGLFTAWLAMSDMSVFKSVNVSTAADTRAGDPGTDHMEDQERWDKLSLYLVYPDGTVTEHTVTRTVLESENPVSFSTWTGTADL